MMSMYSPRWYACVCGYHFTKPVFGKFYYNTREIMEGDRFVARSHRYPLRICQEEFVRKFLAKDPQGVISHIIGSRYPFTNRLYIDHKLRNKIIANRNKQKRT